MGRKSRITQNHHLYKKTQIHPLAGCCATAAIGLRLARAAETDWPGSLLRQTRIRELPGIGQIPQELHPEGSKEGSGRDERTRRAAAGFAGTGADQVALGQAPDRNAAGSMASAGAVVIQAGSAGSMGMGSMGNACGFLMLAFLTFAALLVS